MMLKMLSGILILALIVNLALFAAKIISVTIFWLALSVIGLLAYFALPKLRSQAP